LPSSQVKIEVWFFIVLLAVFCVLWFRVEITELLTNLLRYAVKTRRTSMVGKIFAALTEGGGLKGYLDVFNGGAGRFYATFMLLIAGGLPALFWYSRKRGLFNRQANRAYCWQQRFGDLQFPPASSPCLQGGSLACMP
jgi:hypothetical protein